MAPTCFFSILFAKMSALCCCPAKTCVLHLCTNTHVSQPSSWPHCITFSASPCPYIMRFSRDLPVPPGLRDPAHSQWLDQHFQFPENHNLLLHPLSPHLSKAARCVWRTPGLLCTAGGRNKILPCRRRSGSTPAVLPA